LGVQDVPPIERSRLPPRVSVCFATSTVDVSISSPKWTRTPCPSLRTHHRRMRCQGSDGGDRTLTLLLGRSEERRVGKECKYGCTMKAHKKRFVLIKTDIDKRAQ